MLNGVRVAETGGYDYFLRSGTAVTLGARERSRMVLNWRSGGGRAASGGLAVIALLAVLAVPAFAAETVPVPRVIQIPAGPFLRGSDAAEREAAYRLDERAYGHSVTRQRGWYDDEGRRRRVSLPAFAVTRTVITNRHYAAFIAATGHRAPDVDRQTWKGYRLIHPWRRTRKFAWIGGKPPKSRLDHPVVMVSIGDARAYAAWLSGVTKWRWRLPSEAEWEKAARGPDGRRFPWGDGFDAKKLNSHDAGPFDTVPVGRYPDGASAYGLLDAAGQIFEWTATPSRSGRYIVKGGSWDDKGCGICRPAARHSRPQAIKHILVGFRLVREPKPPAAKAK
jgi:formylglycine-generating enzyme required for sulfatase activity